MKRFFIFCGALALLFAVSGTHEGAKAADQFRIGTGGTEGTYYPVGQTVSRVISELAGLKAEALSSQGSVANIKAVSSGAIDAGFAQSDVAFWAHSGTGLFEGDAAHRNIRAVANLYPESIHIVTRRAAGIQSLESLKGRIVALGERSSGTLVDARLILSIAGLDEKRDIDARYFSTETAVDMLTSGQIDAFFAVAGYPASTVLRSRQQADSLVLPIDGMGVEVLLLEHGFLSRGTIPAGVYGNANEIPTINVSALMIVSAAKSDDQIYRITKALWSAEARKLLDAGHKKGRFIRVETALNGVGVPLHPGAARYYREIGMLK